MDNNSKRLGTSSFFSLWKFSYQSIFYICKLLTKFLLLHAVGVIEVRISIKFGYNFATSGSHCNRTRYLWNKETYLDGIAACTDSNFLLHNWCHFEKRIFSRIFNISNYWIQKEGGKLHRDKKNPERSKNVFRFLTDTNEILIWTSSSV